MAEWGKVAVIGGGVAGLTLAVELARWGIEVWLIERQAVPGGWAARFFCKATDQCQQCLACRVHQLIDEATKSPAIRWLLGTEVSQVQRQGRDFALTVKQAGKTERLFVQAAVLAVGFRVFSAEHRGEFGYRLYPRVLTGADLEQALTQGAGLPIQGDKLKRIGFIQCVGSRDTALGRGYCSQVCCQTSIRQARVLRSQYPDAEINIFYLDLQAGSGNAVQVRQRCQEARLNLVRGIPSRVYNRADGRLGLRLDPGLAGRVAAEPYDLVVLACGMVPTDGLEELARWFGWPLNSYGFLDNRPGCGFQGPVPGVFAVGACRGPLNISQSIAEGQAAALEIQVWLESAVKIMV